jgi:hypothetical protein
MMISTVMLSVSAKRSMSECNGDFGDTMSFGLDGLSFL